MHRTLVMESEKSLPLKSLCLGAYELDRGDHQTDEDHDKRQDINGEGDVIQEI